MVCFFFATIKSNSVNAEANSNKSIKYYEEF